MRRMNQILITLERLGFNGHNQKNSMIGLVDCYSSQKLEEVAWATGA